MKTLLSGIARWRAAMAGLPLLFAIANTHAAVNLSCSAAATDINFGTVNGLSFSNTTNTGTITWTCTNTGTTRTYVTMCLNIGNGSGGVSGTTRLMTGGGSNLQYQLYQDAANTQVWGSELNGANTTPYQIQFQVGGRSSYNGSATVYATLPGGQTGVIPGNYSSTFATTMSTISGQYTNGGTNYPSSCGGTASSLYYPFTVNAVVSKQCQVSAGASINLGSVPSTQTNVSGSNTISVTCTNQTNYFIGLAPSNGNASGAGVMSGTGANLDKVPYQLYSNAGLTTVWGNTATSTSVGNGVSGVGNGLTQNLQVYAVAPNANFTPDSYSDIVTINVNY